jgi:hypothetical protein
MLNTASRGEERLDSLKLKYILFQRNILTCPVLRSAASIAQVLDLPMVQNMG